LPYMEQWFCGRFVNPCMGMKKTPKAFQNKAQGCEATLGKERV
jgi:hypothetical protein